MILYSIQIDLFVWYFPLQNSNTSLILPVKLNNLNILIVIDFVSFDCQVVEHGLGHLPFTEKQVITPTGELRK